MAIVECVSLGVSVVSYAVSETRKFPAEFDSKLQSERLVMITHANCSVIDRVDRRSLIAANW